MTNSILYIILYISLVLVILLIVAWGYNILLEILENKSKLFSPKFYFKEVPFLINRNAIYRVRTGGQFLGIILLTTVIAFTILNNTTPFGVSTHYIMSRDTKNMSKIGPSDRVTVEKFGDSAIYKVKSDLAYFTTEMPFEFETATVVVFYKNKNEDQTYSVGFQDAELWHYATKPYDVPFLNLTSWTKNGYDPVLYQRERNYVSTDSFFNNPPKNAVIGTYEHSPIIEDMSQTSLSSYSPKQSETIINTPLRGKHTIYAYLNNEPFRMKIQKQDLNWYEGADDMKVKIYKNDVLVYEAKADDDGVVDNSQKPSNIHELDMRNPGEDTPESGVYKIIIEANSDTIIRQIRTNLHKIVFANTIFPVSNPSVYPSIVSTASATTLYTNALNLSAITHHNAGRQDILVGDQVLGVDTLHSASYLAPKDNIAEVVIPQNDVVLNGFLGYFAFSRDQFFLPTKYHILPITKAEDVELVDYILTDYLPSRQEGEWQVNEQTFDLRTAFIKDGKLSWIIKAPKLKERNGEIIIKDIQITFHKKGWL